MIQGVELKTIVGNLLGDYLRERSFRSQRGKAMKRVIWSITGCLLLVLLLISPVSAQESASKEVIASGESFVEGGNVPGARQRAIEEALRGAVEQGLGVFISSESYVKNYQTINDKIFSNTKGYVKQYDILSENELGNRYRVSIRALVSLDSIKNDLVATALLRQQMHNPRLMILVGTSKGQVDEAARSARIRLEKTFVEKHFDLMDPATSEKLHNNTKMLLEVTKETVIAAKIGLEHHAEVVLTGIIDSDLLGKSNTGFDSARSTLRLRAIDPTTAKIFASAEESATGLGQGSGEALSVSGGKAAGKVGDYTLQEILNWWQELKSAGVSYRITLKNVSRYPEAIVFEDSVKGIDNVVSLNERVFGGGFLECDVVYKGEKSDLSRAIFRKLNGQTGFDNLNIEIGTGNNIIFSR